MASVTVGLSVGPSHTRRGPGRRRRWAAYCRFSPWPFKRNVGAREPPLSAFIRRKPRQLQLAWSEAAASGVLGFLPGRSGDSICILSGPLGAGGAAAGLRAGTALLSSGLGVSEDRGVDGASAVLGSGWALESRQGKGDLI